MSIRERILRVLLGRALRLQRFVPGRSGRLEAFLGSVALAALGPAELALLTSRLFASQGRYRDRGLFSWEEPWFTADLPPAPARILVGGAGSGREARHLAERGYEIVAFDPVEQFVDQAQDTFAGARSVSFLVGSYEDLTEPRGIPANDFASRVTNGAPYDAVLLGWASLTQVVEPHARLEALRRMRELCPAGPLLASFWMADDSAGPNLGPARRWGARLGSVLGGRPAPAVQVDAADHVLSHSGFGHFFSRAEIETMADKAGYTVARFEPTASSDCFPHATLKPAE